jgi:hypothetical protein
MINEVFDSQVAANEYFELYNAGAVTIDLSTYAIYNRDGSTPLSMLDDPQISPGQYLPIGPAQLHSPTIAGSGLARTDFLGLINTAPTEQVIDVLNWGNAPDIGWPNYERFHTYFFMSGLQPFLPQDTPRTLQRWPDGFDADQGNDWQIIARSPGEPSCDDPYEEDDSFITASNQNANTTNLHRFCPAGDFDFAATALSSVYTYTLRATAVGSHADTVLRLFDPNINLLAESDPPSSRNAEIVFHPASSGYYRMQVSDHNQAGSSGYDYLYNLTIVAGTGASGRFQDVPFGSTFYEYIEGLASQGVISGYPCGGPGEPCIPPQNRPYFRPNNNATRGQTSKIVANTFFPGCNPSGR